MGSISKTGSIRLIVATIIGEMENSNERYCKVNYFYKINISDGLINSVMEEIKKSQGEIIEKKEKAPITLIIAKVPVKYMSEFDYILDIILGKRHEHGYYSKTNIVGVKEVCAKCDYSNLYKFCTNTNDGLSL